MSNQPDDYYGAAIRERTAAEAADLLADECRKKDAALAAVADALHDFLAALDRAPAWTTWNRRIRRGRDPS